MKCLFIAIPRTASTSIREALRPYGLQEIKLDSPQDAQAFDLDRELTTFHHACIPALIETGLITSEWLAERFTFAFVRNPWDRMVSLYHYLFHVLGRHREHYGELTFAEFAEHVTTQPLDPIGPYNWRELSQANPQAHWLEGVQVEFLGQFEHIEADWWTLCNYLKIRASLPRLNTTQRADYREYYTPELVEHVTAFYAKDIELGRYTFE